MADFIVISVVLAVVGLAVAYIVKEKKKGTVCIGCPAAGKCSGKCKGHMNADNPPADK